MLPKHEASCRCEACITAATQLLTRALESLSGPYVLRQPANRTFPTLTAILEQTIKAELVSGLRRARVLVEAVGR